MTVRLMQVALAEEVFSLSAGVVWCLELSFVQVELTVLWWFGHLIL